MKWCIILATAAVAAIILWLWYELSHAVDDPEDIIRFD